MERLQANIIARAWTDNSSLFNFEAFEEIPDKVRKEIQSFLLQSKSDYSLINDGFRVIILQKTGLPNLPRHVLVDAIHVKRKYEEDSGEQLVMELCHRFLKKLDELMQNETPSITRSENSYAQEWVKHNMDNIDFPTFLLRLPLMIESRDGWKFPPSIVDHIVDHQVKIAQSIDREVDA